MKTNLFSLFFSLSIVSTILAIVLRILQLNNAFDAELGHILPGHPATTWLIILGILVFIFSISSAFLLKKGIVSFQGKKTSSFQQAFLILGAVFILAQAGMLLFSLMKSFDATKLVLALFAIYSAISFIVIAKYNLDERDSTAYSVFSAVPVFYSGFMLILAFREKISDPIIAHYIFLIFSYVFILLFSYTIAAHLLGKSRRGTAIFACLLGIFFCGTELISALACSPISFELICELLPIAAFLFIMPGSIKTLIKK